MENKVTRSYGEVDPEEGNRLIKEVVELLAAAAYEYLQRIEYEIAN